ncbi:MAG: HD domain-containing protein [Nitrospirales bacterium]|nr:HD domain-containing protein [Nitrospira sp.]MDR4503117.1 HD domain-containing protein [Nitrospirales bacterium]
MKPSDPKKPHPHQGSVPDDPSFAHDLATQRQLAASRSQLTQYAIDLKTLLRREAKRTRQIERVNQQLKAYARDLKKSYDAEQQKNRELEQAYAETIVRLSLASRYKDEETGGHIERLSHYAKRLALAIGWPMEEAEQLYAAAPMHDVGKIGIPDAVLGKQGPLEEEEWEMVKQHPSLGASLLAGSSSPLLIMAREVAITHHERWDGSGYPYGLQGEAIPLAGRIVMLADHYDALRSRRPYKLAFSHKKTCDVMLNGNDRTKPSHFDPRLLEAFREMHTEFDQIYSRVMEETHDLAL